LPISGDRARPPDRRTRGPVPLGHRRGPDRRRLGAGTDRDAPVPRPRALLGLEGGVMSQSGDRADTSKVSIDTYDACVDFPIFDAKSRSLKKAFLGSAGGAIGRNASNVVTVEALKDITLSLREGDRVGLVGHNGAGKSTLLRLLSGIYEPTRGAAVVRGRVAPVFDLGVGMDPEISGFENILIRGLFLGMSRKQMQDRMDDIAEVTALGDYR